MIIQLCIYLVVGTIGIYYLTLFLHFIGIRIYDEDPDNFWKMIRPFYYWFSHKEKKEKERKSTKSNDFQEKITETKQAVKKATQEVEDLNFAAKKELSNAKERVDLAKKISEQTSSSKEKLKQTKF
jgi:hypothetical protein